MMISDRQMVLERIIGHLEKARSTPRMFMLENARAAQNFLFGFSMALRAVGFEDWGGPGVEEERGYKREPTGIIPQMERRGMDQESILCELFDLEIEGFRRKLQNMRNSW